MKLSPEELERLDPLALTNTITLSALVALLTRKGLLDATELTEEIQNLRSHITAGKSSRNGAAPQ